MMRGQDFCDEPVIQLAAAARDTHSAAAKRQEYRSVALHVTNHRLVTDFASAQYAHHNSSGISHVLVASSIVLLISGCALPLSFNTEPAIG